MLRLPKSTESLMSGVSREMLPIPFLKGFSKDSQLFKPLLLLLVVEE
jgi:hypothetical protein